MKLKYKKIVAREIIAWAIVFAIGIATFILTILYNSYKTKKENIITSEIATKNQLLDSLNSSYQEIYNRITIDDRVFKVLHEFDSTEGKHLSYQELKHLISNAKERKSYFDEYNNKMAFNSYAEFEGLIQTDQGKIEFYKNLLLIDSLKESNVIPLQEEIAKLKEFESVYNKSIMTKEEQYQFSFFAIIISAVLLILLRYVYYGISWSISVLRSQETDSEGDTHH